MSDTIFIVLFRGVGGATQLPTRPLREALTKAGFRNVATYINSGNAILSTALGAGEVAAQVATITRRECGFDKEIMVVSRAAWAKLARNNPFPEAVDAPTTLHLFVLSASPAKDAVTALAAKATGTERFVVEGKTLYLHTPDGMGRSKLAAVIDRTLRVVSTARNWNTVLKLKQMANDAAKL